MLDWTEYAKITLVLLVIVNLIGAVPPFASLTSENSTDEQRRIARIASMAIAVEIFASGIVVLLPGLK